MIKIGVHLCEVIVKLKPGLNFFETPCTFTANIYIYKKETETPLKHGKHGGYS